MRVARCRRRNEDGGEWEAEMSVKTQNGVSGLIKEQWDYSLLLSYASE